MFIFVKSEVLSLDLSNWPSVPDLVLYPKKPLDL